MKRKLEDILAECIDDIKSGKATVEDCLERHASVRRQLEPLLRTALNIEALGDVRPSAGFRTAARVELMERIHAERSKLGWRSSSGTRQPLFAGAFRTAVIVIVVVVALCAAGGGTAYASQDSLPGDTLYPVKLGTEQVQRTFTIDDTSKVKLEMKFAANRLREMKAVAETRPESLQLAADGYEKNINQVMEKMGTLRAAGSGGDVTERVAATISQHLAVLDNLEDSIPEERQETVRRICQAAILRQANALRLLAEEDPERAAEIGNSVMRNRLNRANVKAEESEATEDVEAALGQYEALSELQTEISRKAQQSGDSGVDEMNAQEATGQMAILDEIYKKVPEQKKEVVERVIRRAVERRQQAAVSGNTTDTQRPADEVRGRTGVGNGTTDNVSVDARPEQNRKDKPKDRNDSGTGGNAVTPDNPSSPGNGPGPGNSPDNKR